MKLSWKILVPATMAIVLGIVTFFIKGPNAPVFDLVSNSGLGTYFRETAKTTPTTEIAEPKATGNIEDTIDAISSYSTKEVSIINGDSSDKAVINTTNDAVSIYGDVYDESQF